MATKVSTLARACQNLQKSGVLRQTPNVLLLQSRNAAERSVSVPGSIPTRPLKTKYSLPLVLGCITLGIYVGQQVAKRFAIFMEETEMFVPDDDDD